MKKLLLITGNYAPYVNANTNCISKFVPALQENGFSVTVLTLAYEKGLPAFEERDGVRIFRAAVPEIAAIDRALYQNPRLSHGVLRLVRGVLGQIAYSYTDKLKRRRLKQAFRKADGPFAYMLSVVNPIDAHMTAYRLATPDTKWVMYNLDSYVFNYSYTGSPERRMRIERQWCRKASGVINTVGMREENARRGYDPYRDLAQLDLPLPNFELPQTDFVRTRADGEKTVLRYMGMFYENIRRPDELLRFLETLDPEKYTAEFYGSCCDYLRTHFSALPPCVHLMKTVSAAQCRALTQTADILINVGNTCPNQVPSKIFECIASGRPILNFYSVEDEPGLAYLRRYPCSLHVKDASQVTPQDLDALVENAGRVTVDGLREIYADCLGANVVQRLSDFIDSL